MDRDLKRNLIKTYDRHALERESKEIAEWKIKERDKFLQRLVQEDKESLLEIGAGPGRDSKYFKEQGLKVTATDISPEMVRLCQSKGLRAYVMDFYNLEFPQEAFDAVWALNCLLHVRKENLPQVLKGIKEVLRPDGLFYLGVYGGPDRESVWEEDIYDPPRFFSFYTDEGLKAVVQEFFTLEYFQTIPHKDEIHFQSLILRKE